MDRQWIPTTVEGYYERLSGLDAVLHNLLENGTTESPVVALGGCLANTARVTRLIQSSTARALQAADSGFELAR